MYNSEFLRVIAVLTIIVSSCTLKINSQHSRTYKIDQNWPQESVSNLHIFGSGVAIAPDGNVIVLHRSKYNDRKEKMIITENTLLVIDRLSGEILREWGRNLFSKPHGIEITEEGDIFITDVHLHQVFKFDYNQKTKLWDETPSMILGQRFIQGSDQNHFCSPADVAVMPKTGEIFVADGYCNSRIVKFCKHGHYQLEFGAGISTSSFPVAPLQFNVTHSVELVFNPSKSKAMVLVADRNNGRIQSFTVNGSFLYEIEYENFGQEKAMIFSIVALNNGVISRFEFGRVMVISGRTESEKPKVFEIGLKEMNFTVLESFPNDAYQDSHPHHVAISRDGRDLYIVEVFWNLRVSKFHSSSLNSASSLWDTNIGSFIILFSIFFSTQM